MLKFRRIQAVALLFALLALTGVGGGGSPLWAQLPGSIFGQVVDENEEPIPEVTLTVVDPERPDFKHSVTSNKKGRYKLHLANATVRYDLTLTKEGYQTKRIPNFKVPARQDTRANFILRSAAAVQAEAVASGQPIGPSKGGPVSIYNEGVRALNAGDRVAAKQKFLDALAKKPDLASAHGALARVLVEDGDYAEAVASALKALELNSNEQGMQQVLYNAYTALGETAKADEALTKMQNADPTKAAKNLYNRAADLYNAGKMDEARPVLEQVLATDPANAKVHYMLGLCYVNSGENAKAKELLARFIELAPEDPDAATAQEMMKYLE